MVATGEVVSNLSDIVGVLPEEITMSMNGFIVILKAAGIAAIIYIIYTIVMGIVNFYKMKRLSRIEKRVESIDKKLDLLLKKDKKKKRGKN